MPRTHQLEWLHLTDLHVGQPGEDTLYPNISGALLEDLERQAEAGWRWDVVFFTGDLAFRAGEEEFAVVTSRLRVILDKAAEHNEGRYPYLVTVPGNHDLARPGKDDAARLWRTWSDPGFPARFWNGGEPDFSAKVRQMFTAYRTWMEQSPLPWPKQLQDQGLLPGDFTAEITVHGLTLGIVGLNATFLHLEDGSRGRLEVHPRQLHELCSNYDAWASGHHFDVLLTHHPPEWLSEEGRKQLEGEIHQHDRFALHLYGHEHVGGHGISVMHHGYRHRLQGRSLFGMEAGHPRLHGYTMGRFILEKDRGKWHRSMEIFPRQAESTGGGWTFGKEADRAWWVGAQLGDSPLGPGSEDQPASAPAPSAPPIVVSNAAPSPLPLAAKAIFLSAGIPVRQPKDDQEAECTRTARPEVIREAVRVLGKYVREHNLQLVFGGHPSVAEALLPVATEPSANGPPWLLFYQLESDRQRQTEGAGALASTPGVQLVVVRPVTASRNHTDQLVELRQAMVSLPNLVGAIFVGGLSGITHEFDLMRQERPTLPCHALGCGGGAAARLLLDPTRPARGGLKDPGVLWYQAKHAVEAALTDILGPAGA